MKGGRGRKKRRVYVCAPSRRANRSISVFFRSSSPSSLPFFFFLYLLLVNFNHGWKNFFCHSFALTLEVSLEKSEKPPLWNSTAVQLNPRWHAVRDEKRQQTFTPSPPPLFHEFYNSAYPSSRAGFFFLFFTNMVDENFNSINPETRMWVNNAGSKGTCVPRFHFREDFRERKSTNPA